MTEKKIKQRICISCSEKKDKADLFRVVKTPDGELVIDDTGKVNGHGAYICRNSECIKNSLERKRFDRAFKMHVTIPDELKDRLLNMG